MQITLQHNTPIEIALQDGKQFLQGYFTKFYNPNDPNSEYITPKYRLRIASYALDKALMQGEAVKLRYNHDDNFILGDTSTGLKLSKDGFGGLYSHPYDETDPEFVRVAKKIEKGIIKGSSFQFVARTSWKEEQGNRILTVEEVDSIQDVSPCNDPAIKATGKPIVLSADADKQLAELELRHRKAEARKRMMEVDIS